MAQIPHGYTYTELLAAAVLVFFVSLVIVLILGPQQRVMEYRDQMRHDDVRNLSEILIGLSIEHPESYARIVGTVAGGRTSIGSAEDCHVAIGSQCSLHMIEPHCVDLETLIPPDYRYEQPMDPLFEEGGDLSGYYLYFQDGVMEVGACQPESTGFITVHSRL